MVLALFLSLSFFFLPFSGQNNFSLHTSTGLLYARNDREYNNAFCDTDLLCLCMCIVYVVLREEVSNIQVLSFSPLMHKWQHFCKSVYELNRMSLRYIEREKKGNKTEQMQQLHSPTDRKARFFSSNSGQCGN